MTGIRGDLPAMQAHAKAVEAITARVDKCAGAAQSGSRNLAAWGVLLYPYGEIFVNGLGLEVAKMISALSETGGVCARGVEDCRASYERLEEAMAQMFKGIGT